MINRYVKVESEWILKVPNGHPMNNEIYVFEDADSDEVTVFVPEALYEEIEGNKIIDICLN